MVAPPVVDERVTVCAELYVPVPGLNVGVVTDNATVKLTPLLATPPTVTTTFPVVAPAGTGTTMLDAVQLVGDAAVPLNVTVLVPCVAPNADPAIVIDVPTGPLAG